MSAPGADRPGVFPGAKFRLNRWLTGVFHPPYRFVHKRLEFLHAVEDSLELHPVFLFLFDAGFATTSQNRGRMLYLSRFLFTILINSVLLYFYPQIILKSLIFFKVFQLVRFDADTMQSILEVTSNLERLKMVDSLVHSGET